MDRPTPHVRAGAGWASQTLDRALWQSSVLGLASWQLVVGLFVASRVPEAGGVLVAGHVIVAASAVAAAFSWRSTVVRVAWFGALMALLTADLTLTTDPLATTVLCMTFVVAATPFLVLPPLVATVVTAVGVAAAGTAAALSGPGGRVALALAAPAFCYAAAAGLLSAGLRRFAATTDDANLLAEADQRRLADARVAALTTSEYTRTLHDTVINTLAVIASGSLRRTDADRVRRRCRDDVASLRVLGAKRGGSNANAFAVGDNLALSIEWTGLSEQERQLSVVRLGDRRGAALRGIVREVLQNVEKHAGTDRVVIDVAVVADALRVEITDLGRGFVPDPVPGRGLAESVLQRAADAGIEVDITTAPDQGTVVALRCPGDVPGVEDAHQESGNSADGIRRAGTWGWCAAVSTASLASGAIGTGTPATYASVALVAALSAGAWFACREDRALPGWLSTVIAASTPVAFLLGFVGANFGGGDARFWQAIGLTPLLVILLNLSRSMTALVLACAGLVVAAAGAATAVWSSDPAAAGAAIANGSIQLAQLSVWLIFAKVLDHIAARADALRRRADRARADQAALDAAVRTQQLWREAQVTTALDLLDDIAAGRRSALDPEVRHRAGAEEHHLRQLLMLSPSLVHLGPWLARSISECRKNEVRATVRTGDRDLPDSEAARAVGSTLVELVRGVDEGTDIVIAHFGGEANPGVTVVGPAGFSSPSSLRSLSARSPGCELRRKRVSSQEIVELVPVPSSRTGS